MTSLLYHLINEAEECLSIIQKMVYYSLAVKEGEQKRYSIYP